MIISIDAEKVFEKIQHLFNILKISQQCWNKGNTSQHNKGHMYDKLTAKHKLNGENIKAFS